MGTVPHRVIRLEEQMDDVKSLTHEFRQRFRDIDEKFARVDARFDRIDARFDSLQKIMLQHMRWSIGLLISLVLGFLATQAGILIKFSELVEKF